MGTVQYRVEPNPLTKPVSYKLRFMPKQTAGYDELAAAVAKETGQSAEQAKAFLQSAVRNIKQMLGNGMQVTLEEAFTFAARLNSISASRPFVQDGDAGTGHQRRKSPGHPLRRRHHAGPPEQRPQPGWRAPLDRQQSCL
ncbi:HU family DNA-binding protein [Candidatus Electronema sp. JC]|uniref:HU family DNA-binding protein n=1 Tax=Candidatus Electronema sp. JC TaxID=3401570 RepID=UPI003B42CD7C